MVNPSSNTLTLKYVSNQLKKWIAGNAQTLKTTITTFFRNPLPNGFVLAIKKPEENKVRIATVTVAIRNLVKLKLLSIFSIAYNAKIVAYSPQFKKPFQLIYNYLMPGFFELSLRQSSGHPLRLQKPITWGESRWTVWWCSSSNILLKKIPEIYPGKKRRTGSEVNLWNGCRLILKPAFGVELRLLPLSV